jgi:hypothetical protein
VVRLLAPPPGKLGGKNAGGGAIMRVFAIAVKAAILAIMLKAIASWLVPLAVVQGPQYAVSSVDPIQSLLQMAAYSANLLVRVTGTLGLVLERAALALGLLGIGVIGLRAVDQLWRDDRSTCPRCQRRR